MTNATTSVSSQISCLEKYPSRIIPVILDMMSPKVRAANRAVMLNPQDAQSS